MNEKKQKGETPKGTYERSIIEVNEALAKGGDLDFASEDFDDQVAELLSSGITEEMIEKEKRILNAWSVSVLNETSGERERLKVGEINDEVASTAVVLRRARSFWNHGLSEAASSKDIDTWLAVVATPAFSSAANRANVFPEESLLEDPSQRTGTTGINLFDAILRVGDSDPEYFTAMAERLVDISKQEPTSARRPLQAITNGAIKHAVKMTAEPKSHIQAGGHRPESPPKDSEDALHFARELVKLQEVRVGIKPIHTPPEALARVEFLAVNEVTRLVFEASREDFPLVLQEVNERARKRDSLEYIRGASRLLFNTLEFAASVQGSEGSAAQMRNFLATASHQKGRDIVPTRQSVIALANALTPQLKEMTRDDSLSKLSIDDSMDTLTALDRLFAAVEYGVEGNTGASELVGAVADCSLQLANYGLSDINVIIPPRPGQQPTPPYLAGEGGSRKQVGALKRLRRPGYGSYS